MLIESLENHIVNGKEIYGEEISHYLVPMKEDYNLGIIKYSPKVSNNKAMIVTHGFWDSLDNIQKACKYFTSLGYTVYAKELSGHKGKLVGKEKRSYLSMDREDKDFKYLINEIQKENFENVRFFGCSLGALINHKIANKYGERINTDVVISFDGLGNILAVPLKKCAYKRNEKNPIHRNSRVRSLIIKRKDYSNYIKGFEQLRIKPEELENNKFTKLIYHIRHDPVISTKKGRYSFNKNVKTGKPYVADNGDTYYYRQRFLHGMIINPKKINKIITKLSKASGIQI